MIVGLSPESVRSINVMDEVSYGLENHKLVVPVIIRPCAIPFRLRRVHRVDFGDNYDLALKQLMRALAVESGSPEERATTTAGSTEGEQQHLQPATGEDGGARLVSLDERFSRATKQNSLRLVNHVCEILQLNQWSDKRIQIVEFAAMELLENAFSHGIGERDNGAVRLRVSITPDWCEIQISDTGPGFDLSNQLQMQLASSDREGIRGLAYVSRLASLSQEGSNDLKLWITRDPLPAGFRRYRGIDIVEIVGRVDQPKFTEFSAILERAKRLGSQIAVDLSKVSYVSSVGLRALFLFAKEIRSRAGRTVLIATPDSALAEILNIGHFDRVIPTVATRDEAVAFFER
jgi:anti-sigma B factor antagonist/stage II sporulation protein AA (anti-sigma F factor antagonist)